MSSQGAADSLPIDGLLFSREPITASGCQCLVNPWLCTRVPAMFCRQSAITLQIKAAAGVGPFRQLRRHGRLGSGQCVATGAGRMKRTNYLLHVGLAGAFGRPGPELVQQAIMEAFLTASRLTAQSIALPLVGYHEGHGAADILAHTVQAACKYSGALQRIVVVLEDQAQEQAIAGAMAAAVAKVNASLLLESQEADAPARACPAGPQQAADSALLPATAA